MAGVSLKATMLRVIVCALCVTGGFLANPRQGNGGPASKTMKDLMMEPTDDMLKMMCKPIIDKARLDSTYRKQMVAQMNRVMGKDALGDLTMKMILDQKPSLNRYPRIKNRIAHEVGAK